jgi:hypothetical protein
MAVANFEAILPVSADVNSNGNLSVAGVDLAELANKYSTPLYVYDGATIQHQVSTLRSLFKKYYPGEAAIAYASKVYFSYQMARKLAALGVGLDVISQPNCGWRRKRVARLTACTCTAITRAKLKSKRR